MKYNKDYFIQYVMIHQKKKSIFWNNLFLQSSIKSKFIIAISPQLRYYITIDANVSVYPLHLKSIGCGDQYVFFGRQLSSIKFLRYEIE